jgi:hypothetical protein
MNGQTEKFKRMLDGMVGGKTALVIGQDDQPKAVDILTRRYNTRDGRDGLYVGNHQIALNRVTGIDGNTVYVGARAK